ncbi:MAG: chaplin family protein [Actinoplanes sp.]
MKTWVRKTLSVGVLAAGALLFAPSVAQADVQQGNGDNNGILNGTQLVAPISVPVNVTGNALGILGAADASGVSGNVVERGRDVQSNGDNNGILNGTQAYLPVNVPVNVVGNSAALAGFAQSTGVGANSVRSTESTKKTESGWWGEGGQSNGDNNGILNGTQLYAPVSVPVNVCGNSLAVLGGAFSQGVCSNEVGTGGGFLENGWQSNGDNNGIGNGSQLYAPISLPLNLSGNSAALLGSASSRAVSSNRVEGGTTRQGGHGDHGQSNWGNSGFLNGSQLFAPISVPINFCGNALGILGSAHASGSCSNSIGNAGAFFDIDDDEWGQGGFFGDDWDDDDNWGHGRPVHGHKKPVHHKPGHNKPNDVLGDSDDKDDYLGDSDVAPDDNKGDGYGNAGAEPDANAADAGYGDADVEPDAAGSQSDSKGGRDKADKPAKVKPAKVKPAKADNYDKTEVSPVDGLTDTTGLGGLGLLNTLR